MLDALEEAAVDGRAAVVVPEADGRPELVEAAVEGRPKVGTVVEEWKDGTRLLARRGSTHVVERVLWSTVIESDWKGSNHENFRTRHNLPTESGRPVARRRSPK